MDKRSLDLTPGMWTRSQEIIQFDSQDPEVRPDRSTTMALHSEHVYQDIQTFVDLGVFGLPQVRKAGTEVWMAGSSHLGDSVVICWVRDRQPAPEGRGHGPGATVRI